MGLPPFDPPAPRRRERGGVLLEFGLSMVVLWLIVAATLDLGRAFAAAHLLQSAARTAARDLARLELGAGASFEDALDRVFRAEYLVFDADCLEMRASEVGNTPEAYLNDRLADNGLTLNQMLRPLMVFERVAVGGTEHHLLRYPGALLGAEWEPDEIDCTAGYTVGVPEVNDAESRIDWHGVVEEITQGAFSIDPDSSGVPGGLVAIRLRYPFQAAGLSQWRLVASAAESGRRNDLFEPVPAAPAGSYTQSELPDGATLLPELDAGLGEGEPAAYAIGGRGETIPVYGGSLGLGFQAVLGRVVRPYRQVLSAQAIAEREVFGREGAS